MIIESIWEWPPKGYKLVSGECPNAGRLCNCTGKCQPTLVKEEELDD